MINESLSLCSALRRERERQSECCRNTKRGNDSRHTRTLILFGTSQILDFFSVNKMNFTQGIKKVFSSLARLRQFRVCLKWEYMCTRNAKVNCIVDFIYKSSIALVFCAASMKNSNIQSASFHSFFCNLNCKSLLWVLLFILFYNRQQLFTCTSWARLPTDYDK
jgi:hypothetical protein